MKAYPDVFWQRTWHEGVLARTRHASSLLMCLLVLVGCATAPSEPLTIQPLQPVTGRDLQIVTGQTVYVPAYSEVFYGRADLLLELAVTLAIHNTDTDAPIILQSVRYYDTDGALVRDYVTDPVQVNPLATTGFLVENNDRSGGWGANFIVEWGAETPVFEPVIEAIMIGTRNNQGISFISTGRILSQTYPPDEP